MLVEELPQDAGFLPLECDTGQEMDDSKLLGSNPAVASSKEAVEEPAQLAETEETEVVESSRGSGKRKRGRPSPRLHLKTPASKKEEEDVCFVCFDGGNLVLCDRRGCPKAYHPQCVNHNEAFFQETVKWNCGWHICRICEKASQYMCYTCTYSLCKGCMKEAGLLCVRGNKGFCETCMRTVMLIEKTVQANKQMAQVDFNDKNGWEYLFKEYWLDLKGKLSLTVEELNRARNPLKGSGALAHNEGSSGELNDANVDQGSSPDRSSRHIKASSSTKEKLKKRSRSFTSKGGLLSGKTKVASEGTSVPEDMEWASKELLEFVAHMKDGDMSVLSQFDVQALLSDYIKRNNLHDPRKKSQIKCDARLRSLFGKARVVHSEMLKLLESHFLIKEPPQAFPVKTQGGSMDADAIQMETGGSSDAVTKTGSDKRRKSRKRIEERGPQNNPDDYAAINIHNINLIYLRRNLLEDLLDDMDKFRNKVVGSFVRIRISGTGQKQDTYRLVQVVGTEKAAEAYTTGRKTTDVTLEILNLNMTEVISIDSISNQEFTEEECNHLCESIKCGLISRLTVGEVQEKARALQKVRVSKWLEAEMSRLSNLRDQASEKGRRKELRQCIEKLQLLSTPEERSRLLEEIPEVHADPKMDPNYVSDEDGGDQDEKKQDNYMRRRDAGFSRKGREPISPGKGGSASKDGWNGSQKMLTTHWEPSTNMPTEDAAFDAGEGAKESSWNLGRDANHSSGWETATGSETGASNSQPVIESGVSSNIPEIVPAALTTVTEVSSIISETDKVWHYQDPSTKIQGPFSMLQLRKWSKTGHFPDSLRIWKTSEKQEDSILLTDGLIGMFQKEPPQWETQMSGFSQLHSGSTGYDNRGNNQEGGWSGSNNSTWTDKPKNDGGWKSNGNNASDPPNGNAELSKTDAWGAQSSGWITGASDVVGSKEGWTGSSSRAWDSSKSHSPRSTPSLPGQSSSQQGEEDHGVDDAGRPSGQNVGNSWSTDKTTGFESDNQGFEKPINSKGWEMPSSAVAPKLTTDVWGANQGSKNDLSNLPTTPEESSGGWTVGQSAGNKWSAASVQPAGSGWGTISSGSDGAHQSPTVVSASEKIAAGWGTQACTSEKPAVRGWEGSNRSPASTHEPTVTVDGGRNDLLTPKPSSGGWARPQGDENDNTMVAVPMVASLEPTMTAGSWCLSHIPESQQTTHPEPDASGSLNNQSVPEMPTDGHLAAGSAVLVDDQGSVPFSRAVTMKLAEPLHSNLQNRGTLSVPADNQAPALAGTISSHGGWGQIHESAGDHKAVDGSDQKRDVSISMANQTGDQLTTSFSVLANLVGQQNVKGSNWSTPSASPTTIPSGWGDAGTNAVVVNSQKNSATPSDNWKSGTSNPWKTVSAIEPSVLPNTGWGTVTATKNPDTSWGVTPENSNEGWGAAQVKSMTTRLETASHGNANVGWGTAAQGKADEGWGAASQGNTNVGWGKAAVQGNTNTGWGAKQGNTNAGWGTATQGNTNVGWDASSENSSKWGSQKKNSGERFSGQRDRGFHAGDSVQGGGKPSWNSSMSTGGGGPPRPPPRGQRVCKFHESGHCKKGASCDYLHT